MDHCRFQGSEFDDSSLAANTPAMFEPAPQVDLDLRRVDIGNLHRSKHGPEALQRRQIRCVCLGSSNGRLRVVLQEKVRPIVEQELFAFANNI